MPNIKSYGQNKNTQCPTGQLEERVAEILEL